MSVKYSWTAPMCDGCWEDLEPERIPIRVKQPNQEVCALCGVNTHSGIYRRIDPSTVRFPKLKED